MSGSRKQALTREDLEVHLAEQLEFLKRSTESFDDGFEGEAKRMAVSLRILFHDSKTSHSLLGQLERRSGSFWDLRFPTTPGNQLASGSLVAVRTSDSGQAKYIAPLDDVPLPMQTPFEEWWDTIAFSTPSGESLSRRQLILTAANQDGGAHVDPALDGTYARFSKENAFGWSQHTSSGPVPLTGATSAAIRQVTHESLRTLVPGYKTKRRSTDAAILMGGMSLTVGPSSGATRRGRNEPCPCNSGKKFKKCCGGRR